MKKSKLISLIVMLLLASSLAIAAETVLLDNSKTIKVGGIVAKVTCDTCTKKDDKESTCGTNLCTYKFQDKDKKVLYTLKLKNVNVFLKSTGEIHQVAATKNTKDKQDFNGFLTHMAKDDNILFEDIDTFTYSAARHVKEKDKSIRQLEFCGKKFDAVAGKPAPWYSIFKIQRRKSAGKKKCEITYYKLYNMEDEKKEKDKTPYEYECGDIKYLSGPELVKGVDCLPKLEFTGKSATEQKRKEESRLYCTKKDKTCQGSRIIFEVDSARYKTPMKVVLWGFDEEYMKKASQKEKDIVGPSPWTFEELLHSTKEQYPKNTLIANNFQIGTEIYTPKPKGAEKPKVYFVEDTPFMEVKGGIEVKSRGSNGVPITIRYLPEFFGRPPAGIKFDAYRFRYNLNTDSIEVVYPVVLPFRIPEWTRVENDKAGFIQHVGIKLTMRYKGSLKAPTHVDYEARVKGVAFNQKEQGKPKVRVKNCQQGQKDCTERTSAKKKSPRTGKDKTVRVAPTAQPSLLAQLRAKANKYRDKGCIDIAKGECIYYGKTAREQNAAEQACKKTLIGGLCHGAPVIRCCGTLPK